jgi:hypothetical protein
MSPVNENLKKGDAQKRKRKYEKNISSLYKIQNLKKGDRQRWIP